MPETNAATKYIQNLRNASVRERETPAYFVSGATTSSEVTGSTVVANNTFGVIHFLTNGTFTSITSTQIANSTDWSSATTITAGSILYAKATKIKTKTGAFLMYKYST